ncbi:DUF2090 domain-containing protein [Candidatus Daviesbacteria bacterium]|nr:DUF2090 domain-containing protein [Candidatus Daviesbacteria bacterium]
MDLSKFQINNKFLMLALDHRGSFKKLMNPQNPDSVTDENIINLKNEIIDSLKDQFSALLIDETWGLKACHEICQVKSFLLPLEKSSHSGITELEYTVSQIKEMGASGAKILIDFNPNSENVSHQLEVARKVMDNCRAEDFPLFLEIVTGSTDLVLESVQMFLEEGIEPDVWKLEYPGSPEVCVELTKLLGQTPWILLTGGQTFEEFKPELEVASQNGARGFLAGRALWQEVCQLEGPEKEKFLKETLKDRFKQIVSIATM